MAAIEKPLVRKLNSKREPKNLPVFLRRHPESALKISDRATNVRNPLFRANKVMERVRNIAGTGNGEGCLFIFPLGYACPAGEVMKGILKVLAPKARVSLLVTPKSSSITLSRHISYPTGNIKRIVGKHRPTKVFIMDIGGSRGATKHYITEGLRRVGFNGEIEMNVSLFSNIDEIVRTHTKNMQNTDLVKNDLGRYAMDYGNYLKYLEKQGLINDSPAGLIYRDDLPNSRRFSKQFASARRSAYNLGVALAKEYLESEAAKQR